MLLRQGEGVCLSGDRLLLTSGDARRAFDLALLHCFQQGDASAIDAVIVPRPERLPLVISLERLPLEIAAARSPVALLFFRDPDAVPRGQADLLRRAYGLSPMEARLVLALAEGKSLKEVAQERATSYETVRSHIRRILQKTGARRQVDLVRMVHKLL